MISLKVVDVKNFMSSLLIHNVFDNFLLSEITIHTSKELYISGKLNEDFYSSDELEILNGRKYATWNECKALAYSFIKGNKLPLSIKIVFLLSDENTEKMIVRGGNKFNQNDVNGLFLNVRYDKNGLFLTTGSSIKIFTMDKTLEQLWDNDIKIFLKHHNIAIEEI